jgi:uncharacterized protein (TIGR03067 family)
LRHGATTICCFAFIVSIAVLGQTDAQDRNALQGTWRSIEATSNGDPAPAGMLARLTLVFTGDLVSIMGARPTRYRLDTRFQPAQIDFLNSRNQVGIYELKGDTLSSAPEWMAIGPKHFTPRNTAITPTCCSSARPRSKIIRAMG